MPDLFLPMTQNLEALLEQETIFLKDQLSQNLHSCCVYGSAVRGNFVEGVSDINLLIVLNQSDAAAHQCIARLIDKHPQIDPFIPPDRFARRQGHQPRTAPGNCA
jgi:predicted nucleotidyltransferase